MIVINEGAGSVPDAEEANALHNMALFNYELRVIDKVTVDTWDRHRDVDGDGRFGFTVKLSNGAERVIRMPGADIEQVRYLDTDYQRHRSDFTRMYVDGSSWFWCYALAIVSETMEPEGVEL